MKLRKILAMCLVIVMVMCVSSSLVSADGSSAGVISPVQGLIGTTTISGDNVNLRVGPNTTYTSLGQLNKGDAVALYGYNADLFPNDDVSKWCFVRVDSGNLEGRFGFVHVDYINEVDPANLD